MSAACDHPSVPLEQRVADLVATGRTLRPAEAAEPEPLAATLTDALQKWMRGVEEALTLLAREIEGLPGEMSGVVCKDCPPLERLLDQFVEGGGQLWLCPVCLNARDLQDAEKLPNTTVAGATPMWEWAGSDTTVFSY